MMSSMIVRRRVSILGSKVAQSLMRQSLHMSLPQFRSHTFFYDVLGVTPKATHAQIKAAFYKLSKKYHPDSNPEGGSVDKFHEISEAYEVLGNHLNRKRYDRGLFNPTDHRSGQAASKNVEDATDTSFRPRNYKRRGPIVTGRTKHYDFDTYYKEHYGEHVLHAFKKKHGRTEARNAESLTSDQSHGTKSHLETEGSASPMGLVLTVIVSLYIITVIFDSEILSEIQKSPAIKDSPAAYDLEDRKSNSD